MTTSLFSTSARASELQPRSNPLMSSRSLEAAVGGTPVLWIDRPFATDGRGFWAKLEGFNPGGIKDRPALHMVRRARQRGDLVPGARIVESTSGTLGLGLALAGIAFGHPVTVVTDPGMEPLMHRMLQAHGATVDLVDHPCPSGGWQEARRSRVRQIIAAEPHAYCPDQYHNPDNVEAYAPLAQELLEQAGHIDVLVCSVGTGGHSAGVSRALRTALPGLRLVGVDAIGSSIFGQPVRSRLMRGLGSSILPGNVDYSAFDEVHWVAPEEAVWSCRALASSSYATGGWSVGAVALVAGWVARSAPAGLRIVAIFPDGPQRYFDTVYNDDYCRRHGLLGIRPAQEPDHLDSCTDRAVTHWSRCDSVMAPPGARQVDGATVS